nr:NADH dehydrogenase subunit 2 [Synarthrophyton patena]
MTTNFTFDIYFTLPEIYLAISSFYLIIFGVFLSVSKFQGYPLLTSSFSSLSIQVIFCTIYLVVYFPYFEIFSWNYFLIGNNFVLGAKIILGISTITWIILSRVYTVHEKLNSFEYWILILLIILALFLLLQTNDLTTTYLLIEFQSLSFYILASFKRSSEFSTEAGLKYFVLGAFSSGFLLFGSSFLYGLTGLTNFLDFNTFFTGFLQEDKFLLIGVFVSLMFIATALFFKISAAPFHMWSPDVYEGAPTSVTAFFAIFPKLVIITLFLRIFLLTFYDFFTVWKTMFLFVSFMSLLIGSLGALLQKKWKRFLAYSSINHVGFILVGFLSGELLGINSILLYLFIYIITTFSIFTFLLSSRFYKYPSHYQIRYLLDVINLSKTNPLLAISLVIILFSMAGIPPLSGFFAKVFVLLIGLQSSSYFLTLFAILASSIACFYYIRIIQLMYFTNYKKWIITSPLAKSNSLILGLSCIFLILFFSDIELFFIPISRMALAFLS